MPQMSACAIEWEQCAKEGESCKCDGRVRFGSLPASLWDDSWSLEKMPGSFNASGVMCREAATQGANASGFHFLKAFPAQKGGSERICQCGKEQVRRQVLPRIKKIFKTNATKSTKKKYASVGKSR
jgi:hypothetical protein